MGFGVRVAWRLGLGCSVTPFETAVSKVSAGWLGVGAGVGVELPCASTCVTSAATRPAMPPARSDGATLA